MGPGDNFRDMRNLGSGPSSSICRDLFRGYFHLTSGKTGFAVVVEKCGQLGLGGRRLE